MIFTCSHLYFCTEVCLDNEPGLQPCWHYTDVGQMQSLETTPLAGCTEHLLQGYEKERKNSWTCSSSFLNHCVPLSNSSGEAILKHLSTQTPRSSFPPESWLNPLCHRSRGAMWPLQFCTSQAEGGQSIHSPKRVTSHCLSKDKYSTHLGVVGAFSHLFARWTQHLKGTSCAATCTAAANNFPSTQLTIERELGVFLWWWYEFKSV